ncbi:DUF2062 domain-containing protein [Sphingorhabdus sp. SMR4y]|uniref:DUF2062 domain-containing protein n=1 Tax=Sphingorhabdus sp. SMR4y TaxID=2584094 RepID=UPI0021B24F86|nr:DUF2062 domain-containing protein [Sphingorhabdus sp. SMR4y]
MADPRPHIRDKDFAARLIMYVVHWFQRKMPTRAAMERNKYLKPIAHRFLRSELWRFTRRSVPRGVALGMLAAFLVPVGQIFAAVFLALPVRANVPIAAITTFITNPLTYPFWIAAANQTGKFVLQFDAMTSGQPINTHIQSEFGQWLSWLGREAGVTAFGFLLFAIFFAAIGYLVSSFGWRWWIARKRKGRLTQTIAGGTGDGE